MRTWATQAAEWIGDGATVATSTGEKATVRWPNGERAYILRDSRAYLGWRFAGAGYDPSYAAQYACACGYQD